MFFSQIQSHQMSVWQPSNSISNCFSVAGITAGLNFLGVTNCDSSGLFVASSFSYGCSGNIGNGVSAQMNLCSGALSNVASTSTYPYFIATCLPSMIASQNIVFKQYSDSACQQLTTVRTGTFQDKIQNLSNSFFVLFFPLKILNNEREREREREIERQTDRQTDRQTELR